MAVKSKTALGKLQLSSHAKTTTIGQGRNSRPNRKGKKKLRGQGK